MLDILSRLPTGLTGYTRILQLDLFLAGTRPAARTLSVIGHGEFRRLLRQIERESQVVLDAPPRHTTPTSSPAIGHYRTGWLRPVHADHAELAAAEAAHWQLRAAHARPGAPGASDRTLRRRSLCRRRGGTEGRQGPPPGVLLLCGC